MIQIGDFEETTTCELDHIQSLANMCGFDIGNQPDEHEASAQYNPSAAYLIELDQYIGTTTSEKSAEQIECLAACLAILLHKSFGLSLLMKKPGSTMSDIALCHSHVSDIISPVYWILSSVFTLEFESSLADQWLWFVVKHLFRSDVPGAWHPIVDMSQNPRNEWDPRVEKLSTKFINDPVSLLHLGTSPLLFHRNSDPDRVFDYLSLWARDLRL